MCKKELSSNRINDPLASIYRTRGGRAARTNSSNCLRGDGAAAASTSSFCRTNPVRGKYYLLSCGAGSLCRRRKFNRPLSFSGRVCKSCFRLHRLHRFSLAGYRAPGLAVVVEREYPGSNYLHGESNPKIRASRGTRSHGRSRG